MPRSSIFSDSIVDDGLKNRVRDAVLNEYNKIGYKEGINAPFNQHPHAKTMVFTPLSSMSGVTGSMGPFFCEFTLNGDILPHDYPATYAHEFAHFLGVANEGEANFYSYIVCTASADKQVRFSGYYHIFFHVLNNVFDILGEKEGERIPETYPSRDYPAGKERPPLLAQQAMQGIGCRTGYHLRFLPQGQPCGGRQEELFRRYRLDTGLGRKKNTQGKDEQGRK